MTKVGWGKRSLGQRKSRNYVPRIIAGSLTRMFKLPKMMRGIVVNRQDTSQIQKAVLGREHN